VGHTLRIEKEYYSGVKNQDWKGSEVAIVGCCPNAQCKLPRVVSTSVKARN
jgi:hypothetical protein